MSRFKQFSYTLISGYLMMGANVAFTLASVPLALHHLSKAEFGLWALTTQIAGYVALIDLGMAGALTRILVDYKDDVASANYGSLILTGFLVSLAQGCLILGGGVGLAWLLAPLLDLPAEVWREFRWLVIWQCVVLATAFAFRIAGHLLAAHQRSYIVNFSQAISFLVNYGVLWFGFARGWGVFSMVWAQLAAQVIPAAAAIVACVALRLFPAAGRWGAPTWTSFCELFAFGRDMFFYSLGGQLVNASQLILITRLLGLDTGAVWSVCTRALSLLNQLVYRIFDSACLPLAEMMVRGESDRLLFRFKSIVVLSASLAVLAGVMFAACNQPFVRWWTGRGLGWTPVNDWLLAFWFVLTVLVRVYTGLAGLTKEFRFLRYVYFLEGLFFVGVSWLVLRPGGVTAMIGVSIAGSLLFSLQYGIRRVSEYFQTDWKAVALEWIRPSLRLALLVLPMGATLAWLSRPLSSFWGFAVVSAIIGAVGGFFLFRWGLDEAMRAELRLRVSSKIAWLRNWLGQPRG